MTVESIITLADKNKIVCYNMKLNSMLELQKARSRNFHFLPLGSFWQWQFMNEPVVSQHLLQDELRKLGAKPSIICFPFPFLRR